jgi:gliding motility-associated lipoprotein GldD
MIKYIAFLFIVFVFVSGCTDKQNIPKPRAYPKVEYPEKKYILFDSAACPVNFEYPAYAEIINKAEDCWFDLYIDTFDARIHCSYMPIDNQADFDDLISDSYEIADRINARANYMEDSRIKTEQGISGVLFEWSGPAASNMHFFLTDSTQHFFRGALYFDSKVQIDSLAPIAAFLKEDIQHLISTFKWRNQ